MTTLARQGLKFVRSLIGNDNNIVHGTAALPALYALQRHMSKNKLFIGGLPWEATGETLRDAFSSFGEVQEAKVIVDRATNRSKGFGFVEFSNSDDAQMALQEMDGRELGGRTVRVDYAVEKDPSERRAPRMTRDGYGVRGGYGNSFGGESHEPTN